MQQKPNGSRKQGKPEARRSALSRVVRRNIRALIQHQEENAHQRTIQERVADAITNFSGSMTFVYFHIAWFGLWILLNTGKFGVKPFDPFPYGLLTMVVSLEAIFLSTFVLISQNQMSKNNEERAELDLQINLLTERELTRVLMMLDTIQKHLGIESDFDSELADLEKETNPEDVLKEIQKNKNTETKKQ